MVMHLRRRLSGLWNNVLADIERRRLAVTTAPPIHDKVTEERIKSRVNLLNAIGLGLFAGGVINPALATAEPVSIGARLSAAIIAAMLIMAGQRYLRYIPRPTPPKETDHV